MERLLKQYTLKGRLPKTLKDILKEKWDHYTRLRDWVLQAYELMEILKAMSEPLQFIPGGNIEFYIGHWSTGILGNYVQVNCYSIPYETIIEEFAGPLHRQTGCLWTLRDVSILELTGKPFNIRTDIKINEGEMKTCEVIKIPIKPTITENYKYVLDCGDGYDPNIFMEVK